MADDDIKAMTPDGVTHVFPAGTPDKVIDNAIKTHLQLTTGQGMMTPKSPVPTPYGLQTPQQQAVTNAGQPQLAGAGLVPFNAATAGVGSQLSDEQRVELAKSAMVQGATEGGGIAVQGLADTLQSTAAASKLFDYIKNVAGTHTVHVTEDVGKTAFEAQQLSKSGSYMPKVMRDFITRASESLKKPITYDEARMFYSNATKLTADEAMKTDFAMKRLVGKFANAWGGQIAETAGKATQSEKYIEAMKGYEQAKKAQAAISATKSALAKTAGRSIGYATAGATGGAVGGYVGRKLAEANK